MTDMSDAEDLSTQLWQERGILEMLLFKLEEAHVLLATGRHHWLQHATSEVSQVLAALSAAEDRRARIGSDVALSCGLSPDATLANLAAELPEPWGEIMSRHREALLSNLKRVQAVASTNREILRRSLSATTDALAVLGGGEPGYQADGSTVISGHTARLVDASI